VTQTEEFEELRPLLFAIAYRILGSASEAEDAVQETWLRYEASPTQPTSTKAFLSAVVTRISIDVLRSARVRREEYVGPWFPEPLLTDPYEDPERSAELADSLSMAALLMLERLTPLERAVFVLRDVFGFGFPEIAAAVGRSEAACRQLAVRARRHMDAGRPRFEADRREREELAERFFGSKPICPRTFQLSIHSWWNDHRHGRRRSGERLSGLARNFGDVFVGAVMQRA
jgi:RNA polymerase sigma-70 factor, ECF subfamily